MQELLKAFIFIFIAEMGDKTQILAMAFATKFPVKKVLFGIFLGSFFNHGLAVILGNYISEFIPINTIQIVAGLAFIGFSFWTLKLDDEEDDDENVVKKNLFGPVLTVALAFFVGELGDKTQLTAITLATTNVNPLAILAGTVLGMTVTGGIGIIIGKKLGDKIPEVAIKLVAASVFLFFGIVTLYQAVPVEYLSLQNVGLFFLAIFVLLYIMLKPFITSRKLGEESAFKKKSRELYNYYNEIGQNIDKICLGKDTCGDCHGNSCLVGFTKTLIKNGLEKHELLKNEFLPIEDTFKKHYNKEQVIDSLSLTISLLKDEPNSNEFKNIHEIRKKLETILFKRSIERMDNWEQYKNSLLEIDKKSALKIFEICNALEDF